MNKGLNKSLGMTCEPLLGLCVFAMVWNVSTGPKDER